MDKRIGNSRIKDFNDIYVLMKLHKNLFDFKILNAAIKTTFDYRNTLIDKEVFNNLLTILEKDDSLLLDGIALPRKTTM